MVDLISNVKKFNITCNSCGSKNVKLSSYCNQDISYGYLTCLDCKDEEESCSEY